MDLKEQTIHISVGTIVKTIVVIFLFAILFILKDSAEIKNFWEKKAEIRTMEGLIDEELSYSKIENIKQNAVELRTELMKLAKNRISELRK